MQGSHRVVSWTQPSSCTGGAVLGKLYGLRWSVNVMKRAALIQERTTLALN
jgi:hypothetical protein